MNIKLEKSWLEVLKDEFEKDYFHTLRDRVRYEYEHYRIYPKAKDIFRAMDLLPINKVKVVILGQDPYHGEGQAEGLAFSVPDNIAVPPSLINIKKEILNDTGRESIIKNGNLLSWVEQGVFLLNSSLTVRAGLPASHRDIGWEIFTDAIIRKLSDGNRRLVFILWGAFARSKSKLIDRSRHLILESAHPSPLSAYKGFFNSKPFTACNNFLVSIDDKPIHW